MIGKKIHRAREALFLITRAAADGASRRALFEIYLALSKPERYSDKVSLRLRISGQVFPVTIRVQDIFVLGEILFERQYHVRSKVTASPFIVDAGANVGIAALWLLGRYPGFSLHAFEPERENFDLLEKNLACIPGTLAFKSALGAETGSIDLKIAEFGAMHSLKEGFNEGAMTERVPLITLADHLEAHGIDRIDLLKLDVEGAEMEVLSGLGERIKDVAVIIGEMHESVIDESTFYGFLKEAGFEIVWRGNFSESETERVHGFEAVQKA